jgi:hypothetical protein
MPFSASAMSQGADANETSGAPIKPLHLLSTKIGVYIVFTEICAER